MMRKKFLLLPIIVICFVSATLAQTEQTYFRKCYIIAYNSKKGAGQFSNTEQKTNLKKTMISLFNNQKPDETIDQHTRIDAGNFSDLFNPETDEILFFDFGINRDKYDYNNRNYYPDLQDTVGIFNYFMDNYFRLQNRYSRTKGNIDDFLDDSFRKCRDNITGTTAPSSCVFPLILAKIPQEINAEEYGLLMLSDYNDPTGKGQNEDITRLDEAIHKPSRLILENAFIKPMRSKTNFSEIFQYGYKHYPNGNLEKNPTRYYVYLVGYKINCENIEKPTIESNIKLKQKKYGEDRYEQDAVKLRFPHNEFLRINSIYEQITSEKGNIINMQTEANKENNFYSVAAAEVELPDFIRNKEFHTLEVKYTFHTHLQLLDFCRLGLVYTTLQRELSQSDIVFQDAAATIFWYWFWWILLFVILAGLILLVIAVLRGRNITINDKKDIKIDGFTGKFKEMKDCVTTELNHCALESENSKIILGVKIEPQYKKWFRWKWNCELEITAGINGYGLEKSLDDLGLIARIQNVDGSGEKSLNEPFVPADNEYSISITKTKQSGSKELKKQYVFEIVTSIKIKKSFLWRKEEVSLNNVSPYKFAIGKDLGKIWVGLDPGTTGSSAAFGNDKDKIYFSRSDIGGVLNKINSSVIAFKNDDFPKISFDKWAAPYDYYYGDDANGRTNLTNRFRSMKKVLGYDTKYSIKIGETEVHNLTGQQIFELQIRGIYKDLENYIDKTDVVGYLTTKEKKEMCDGKENANPMPRRAVVAIPNCFTPRRTQAMINSIASLGKFDEIISTYEAEAVLYHCIQEEKITPNSKVMIFDMGGATINTSFFDYRVEYKKDNRTVEKYKIDTLGRIGYGIGGDTIDFYIIKAILSMSSVQEALKIDAETLDEYRNSNKEKLIQLALDVKIKIVDNWDSDTLEKDKSNKQKSIEKMKHILDNWGKKLNAEQGQNREGNKEVEFKLKQELKNAQQELYNMPYLIDANQLSIWLKKHLDIDIKIDFNSDDFSALFGKKGKKLFDDFLESNIYQNIKDAINEMSQFNEVSACKNEQITLIFSGRSTAFPKIKDRVKEALSDKSFSISTVDLQEGGNLDGLKTIVAEGACWYGLNRQNVELSNNKTFYSFVVKNSRGGGKDDTNFITFINQGQKFQKDKDGNLEIRESRSADKLNKPDFSFDNYKANVYQVTGNNPKELYNIEGKKHKINFVFSVEPKREVKEIELVLSPDDKLRVFAQFDKNTANEICLQAQIKAVEIADENDEHYIFATKNNG